MHCPAMCREARLEVLHALLRAIVGVEIPVASLEGKWKISQNRNEADRQGVIRGLAAEGRCPEMHRLMESD